MKYILGAHVYVKCLCIYVMSKHVSEFSS